MDIIGHRGRVGHPEEDENTVSAVAAALAEGADGVEVDVRLSADGVPVCVHDRDLWRLTGQRVDVQSLSYAALSRLALRGSVPIAALEALIEHVQDRALLVLDLKGDADPPARLVDATVATLRRARLGDRVVMSSFWPEILAESQRVAPQLQRALITDAHVPAAAAVRRALAMPGTDVHLHLRAALSDHSPVGQAVDAGRAVRCWTVNRPADARLLDIAGVTAVITDDPGGLRRSLGRQGTSAVAV